MEAATRPVALSCSGSLSSGTSAHRLRCRRLVDASAGPPQWVEEAGQALTGVQTLSAGSCGLALVNA